jgi:hypothetical protein
MDRKIGLDKMLIKREVKVAEKMASHPVKAAMSGKARVTCPQIFLPTFDPPTILLQGQLAQCLTFCSATIGHIKERSNIAFSIYINTAIG